MAHPHIWTFPSTPISRAANLEDWIDWESVRDGFVIPVNLRKKAINLRLLRGETGAARARTRSRVSGHKQERTPCDCAGAAKIRPRNPQNSGLLQLF